MSTKYRTFSFSQQFVHPETGEELTSMEKIQSILEGWDAVDIWAIINHDKDVYTETDVEEETECLKKRYEELKTEEDNDELQDISTFEDYYAKYHKKALGSSKAFHVQGALRMKSPAYISQVAKRLKIPEGNVHVLRGSRHQNPFLDGLRYLTHESQKQQELGKHLYGDNEVISNVDFRAEIEKENAELAKYGANLSTKERFRYDVLYNGMTLNQVIEADRVDYMDDWKTLEKDRLEYISKIAPMPKTRVNFYLEGKGGMGKDLMAQALARCLIDPEGKMEDDDIFFTVGSDAASFEGYDGQPVIIWADTRGAELIRKLGGRGNCFAVFDSHPKKQRQNVKYGSVLLKNSVNIVHSVETFSQFIDDLSGEYKAKDGTEYKAEDKNQARRRFPIFMVLHEEDYDLYVSKGVLEGNRAFDEYIAEKHLQGSLQRVVSHMNNPEIVKSAETAVLEKPVEYGKKVERALEGTDIWTEEEARAYIGTLGKPVQDVSETADAEDEFEEAEFDFDDFDEAEDIPFV